MAYFTRLGREVERRWTERDRRPEELSEIAQTALHEIPVPEVLTPEVVLGLLTAGSDLPKQRASSDLFGQPPAVMYRGANLEVQAITWMEGTTSIHQHGFDGAFLVAAGSSLHVRYSFDPIEFLGSGHLVHGDLLKKQSEILRTGDVRPIVSGPGFIHALFHLERPSMSIVVRTGSSDLPFPQYDYRLPGLGIDVLDTDDRLRMRLRGLHSLHRLDRDRAASVARQALADGDLWTAFRICDDWALTHGVGPELSSLIEVLAHRQEALAKVLPLMYAEDMRRGRLLARRGLLSDPRHRLLLALIVNLPDRASIHSALRQCYPDEDPAQFIVNVVEELASPQFRGASGLHLSASELDVLKAHFNRSQSDDAVDLVAVRWKPPVLLEKFFV